jgi:hypothetical protein
VFPLPRGVGILWHKTCSLGTAEEIMQADIAQKGQVMAAQRQLLERRYNLTPQVDSQVTMSRSKPVPIGQPPSSHRA